MATTKGNRVGQIRIRLAQMLMALGYRMDPSDLHSQIPWYARRQQDCCSWYSWATWTGDDMPKSIFSYDQMRLCVRRGIVVRLDPDNIHVEVSARGPTTNRQATESEEAR